MTNTTINLSEKRVVAIYNNKDSVERAKTIILRKLGISERKIEVIAPSDANISEKLEGESQPLGKNIRKAYLFLGGIGLLLGMLVASILVEYGPPLTTQNPMFTYIAFISPGLYFGIFATGFFSLMPIHDKVNINVIQHKNANHWALLVDTDQSNIQKEDLIEEIEQTDTIAIHS